MNSYDLQYMLLGHVAGILAFELCGFGRDSLIETGKCPTKTEVNGYAAYQIMADDMGYAFLMFFGFFASTAVTGYRLWTAKRNKSNFDLVNMIQHILLAVGLVRNLLTLREIERAGPMPSDVFMCKTVMMFSITHLGQLFIQVFTMLLLTHFAYDESMRNVSKDKKRALTLFTISHMLLGFLSGYYTIFSIMFDRITFFPELGLGLDKVRRLQQTYSAVLTAPAIFILAPPLTLMWSMMLSLLRWSIWRTRIEVGVFGLCSLIGLAMAIDYVIVSQETLAVEVSDIHTKDELMGFFRITGYSHALIAFILCPLVCAVVSRSERLNENRLHEARYVGRELKPPPGEIRREEVAGVKTVKAA